MLKFENVSKSFGKIKALVDINFKVEEGEFVFITGASGAGKTTILRLILKEIDPDSGSIELDGKDITKLKNKDVPKLRQGIGTVFQDFKILPERTLRENIELALAVLDVPQKQWKDRVDHVLNMMNLLDRDNLFPSQLSGGEMQRAALARALVVNPKIILADEPTGNLDWDTAEGVMELFEKVSKEGKTIIMATHHRLIVDKMKKREIKLDMGEMVKDKESPEKKKPKEDKK